MSAPSSTEFPELSKILCSITYNIKHRLQCLGKTVYWLAERDAARGQQTKPPRPKHGSMWLRVNGGDLALPRGRRLNRWRKNVQSGKS